MPGEEEHKSLAKVVRKAREKGGKEATKTPLGAEEERGRPRERHTERSQ